MLTASAKRSDAMANKKYYVVWVGLNPGVYDNWEDAKEQVTNFPGARYRSFSNPADAANAYREGMEYKETLELGNFLSGLARQKKEENKPMPLRQLLERFPEIDKNAWAVDASCMGNPGVMEYRGVELKTGKELFRVGPFQQATNNIGEFLAIVHALALMTQRGEWHTVYTDSVSGLSWVRRKQIKTTLKKTDANRKVFELMVRAMAWLNTHSYPVSILKWQTELWGEIPADFGRK